MVWLGNKAFILLPKKDGIYMCRAVLLLGVLGKDHPLRHVVLQMEDCE